MDVAILKAAIQQYGIDALAKRFDRLKNRHIVLFPVLRALMLLKKLRKLMA